MEQDIHKLADWIEKVTREGIAIERKVVQWESRDENVENTRSALETKAR